jgi:hypothetical protein
MTLPSPPLPCALDAPLDAARTHPLTLWPRPPSPRLPTGAHAPLHPSTHTNRLPPQSSTEQPSKMALISSRSSVSVARPAARVAAVKPVSRVVLARSKPVSVLQRRSRKQTTANTPNQLQRPSSPHAAMIAAQRSRGGFNTVCVRHPARRRPQCSSGRRPRPPLHSLIAITVSGANAGRQGRGERHQGGRGQVQQRHHRRVRSGLGQRECVCVCVCVCVAAAQRRGVGEQ